MSFAQQRLKENTTNTYYRNLIIDGSFLLHTYALTLKPLYNSEFEDISIAYYFTRRIYNLVQLYKPLETVYIVLDVGRDIKKKQKYELYKANRHIAKKSDFTSKTLDEDKYNRLKFNRKLLYTIFRGTPINLFAIPYIEGDTVMAYFTHVLNKERKNEFPNKYSYDKEHNIKNNLIITADKDFIQLVNEDNDLLLLNTINNTILYTNEIKDVLNLLNVVFFRNDNLFKELFKEFLKQNKIKNFDLRNIVFYRAFTGDISDNITGIKGFGEKLVSTMLLYQTYKNRGIENSFETVEDFLNFWRTNIDEFSTKFIKAFFPRRRINTRRLRQFLNNDEEIKLYKTFFEIMDFKTAIDTLQSYVRMEILKEFQHSREKSKTYLKSDFLNIMNKYEFNSDSEYILWNFINQALEINLNTEPFTTLENNGWQLYKFLDKSSLSTYQLLEKLNSLKSQIFKALKRTSHSLFS